MLSVTNRLPIKLPLKCRIKIRTETGFSQPPNAPSEQINQTLKWNQSLWQRFRLLLEQNNQDSDHLTTLLIDKTQHAGHHLCTAMGDRIRVHQIKHTQIIGLAQLGSTSHQDGSDQVIRGCEHKHLVLPRLRRGQKQGLTGKVDPIPSTQASDAQPVAEPRIRYWLQDQGSGEGCITASPFHLGQQTLKCMGPGSIGREGLQLRLGAPKTLGIPAAMGLEPPLQQLILNISAEGLRERLLKQPIEIGQ
jgi:hypothetical protein